MMGKLIEWTLAIAFVLGFVSCLWSVDFAARGEVTPWWAWGLAGTSAACLLIVCIAAFVVPRVRRAIARRKLLAMRLKEAGRSTQAQGPISHKVMQADTARITDKAAAQREHRQSRRAACRARKRGWTNVRTTDRLVQVPVEIRGIPTEGDPTSIN